MRKFIICAILIGVTMSMTGCFYKQTVESNQFGIIMKDGVAISEVVGPGRYTDMGFYAEMTVIDGQVKQTTWSDTNIYTSDNQPISLSVSIEYSRGFENAKSMYEQYHEAAIDDEALKELVNGRISGAIKSATNSQTIEEMIGRGAIMAILEEELPNKLTEIGVILHNVDIKSVDPDAGYNQMMTDKALAKANQELIEQQHANEVEQIRNAQENEETRIANEQANKQRLLEASEANAIKQLAIEKAQTEVDLEKARRDNLVAEEEAKIYSLSPETLQLELARIQADALKQANTIYLPSESNINMYTYTPSVITPNNN